MIQHKLNEHSSNEQREKEFKYYCKNCNYGSISIDLFNKHLNTNKHNKNIKRLLNNDI
jgi:hypothetical protein